MPAKSKSKKKKGVKRLPERVLFELGREFEDFRKKAARWEAKKKEVQATLVEQLKARKVTTIQGGDDEIRITVVENEYVNYDPEQLKDALTAAQWKRIRKEDVDKDKLAAEVAAGNIDPKVVAQCAFVTTSSPYIRIGWGGE